VVDFTLDFRPWLLTISVIYTALARGLHGDLHSYYIEGFWVGTQGHPFYVSTSRLSIYPFENGVDASFTIA